MDDLERDGALMLDIEALEKRLGPNHPDVVNAKKAAEIYFRERKKADAEGWKLDDAPKD